MSLPFRTGLAALALPAAALAQQGQPAHPADANAAVPPYHYVSAFTTNKAADETPSPDQVWRTANQEVANAGMPGMQGAPHGAHQPDAHAGHGAHHHQQGK